MTVDKSMAPQAKEETCQARLAETADMRPAKKIKFSKKADVAIPALPKKEAPLKGCKTCPKCDESFNSVHSFTVHIKTHNTEDRVCGICGKMLSSPSSRDRHMLTHSGERPFVCRVCKSNFTTNGNMHRHMKTHQDAATSRDESGSSSEGDDSTKEDTATSDHLASDPRSSSPVMTIVLERVEDLAEPKSEDLPSSVQETPSLKIEDPTPVEHEQESSSIPEGVAPQQPVKEPCGDDGPKKKRRIVGFDDLSAFEVSAPRFPLIAASVNRKVSRTAWSESHDCVCNGCGNAFPCKSSLQYHRSKKDCPDCNCFFLTEEDRTGHLVKYHSGEESCSRQMLFFRSLGLLKKCIPAPGESPDSKPEQNIPPKAPLNQEPRLASSTETEFKHSGDVITDKQTTSPRVDTNNLTAGNDFASIFSILHTVRAVQGSSSATGSPGKHEEGDVPPTKSDSTKNQIAKKYVCETCGYGSDDKSSLNRHRITHSEERPFTCVICDATFTNRSNGERHVRDKHKLKERNEISKAVKRNRRSSDSPCEEFKCKYCRKTFESSQALQHHIRSQNDSCQQKPFQCSACGAFASTKNNISRHINKKHGGLVSGDSEKERKAKTNAMIMVHPVTARSSDPVYDPEDTGTANDFPPSSDKADSEASRSGFGDALITKDEAPETEEFVAEPDLTVTSSGHQDQEGTGIECAFTPSPAAVHPSHLNDEIVANEGMLRLADVCSEAPRLSLEEPLDLSVRAMDLTRSPIDQTAMIRKLSFNNFGRHSSRTVPPADSVTFTNPPPSHAALPWRKSSGDQRGSTEYVPTTLDLRTTGRKSRKQSKNQVYRLKSYRRESGISVCKSFNPNRQCYVEPATRKALHVKDLQSSIFGVREQHLKRSPVKTESVTPDEREANSDLENVDLASVPSVINTANSSKIGSLLNYDVKAATHVANFYNSTDYK